tara:strand:+ start:71 stop:421 length:351 start_codon:yes stop_codon:yes gene_type:complete
MNSQFDRLNTEEVNLLLLKVFCVLEENKYSQLVRWPFEDISIEDVFSQIKYIYSSSILKEKFTQLCLNHIKQRGQYSVIEGLLNFIRLFEDLERYEDCIILKNIQDNILLDLESVN